MLTDEEFIQFCAYLSKKLKGGEWHRFSMHIKSDGKSVLVDDVTLVSEEL